jgi:Domain of unknown function (DUF4129)
VATGSRSAGRRGPPAVAWVLVLAVLVGVAAALLSRPVGPVAPSAPGYSLLTWSHWGEVIGIIALLGAGFWLYLLFRDSARRAPIPGRVVASILTVVLIGVILVEVVAFVHFLPSTAAGNSTGSTGGTGTSNGTGNRNMTLFGGPSLPLPGWVGIAAVLVIALVAAVFIVPYAVHRAEERRRERAEPESTASEAQRALHEALDRLGSADGSDARAAILALYSRLLLLVGPRLEGIETRTPREIERASIDTLGLRPAVARDLRETFEEARYSTHPMSVEAVERARHALTEAMSDLASVAGPTQ